MEDPGKELAQRPANESMQLPVPVHPTSLTPVETASRWVELVGKAAKNTVAGSAVVVAGSVGGLELFAPDVLSFVDVGSNYANLLLFIFASYFGIGLPSELVGKIADQFKGTGR